MGQAAPTVGQREPAERSQSNYAGSLARRSETNLAVAGIFGLEGLLHQVEPFAHAVQREDIQWLAQRYLDANKCVTVMVGREAEA